MSQRDDDFTIWTNSQPSGPGQMGLRGAVLKTGAQVAKVVTVAEYGDKTTGEVSRRELVFRTVPRRSDSPGYDYDNPAKRWACEDEEIERLLAFLEADVAPRGRYRVLDTASPVAAALEMLSDAPDHDGAAEAFANRQDLAELLRAIATTDAGRAAVADAVLAQRRERVASLQALAATPGTSETDMQRLIGDAHWLFGGHYVGVADRRNLAPLDEHDIPLLGADGTLHVVELKGPDIPKLIRRHRNHWIVGNEIHEAVSQAMNYLRSLDELGAALQTTYQNEFGQSYDMRRVFATVVIGHPDHVVSAADAAAQLVDQTIRSYNAHLSRIEVVTFKSLLDAAARALEFEQTSREVATANQQLESVERGQPPSAEMPWAVSPEQPPF